MPVELFWRVGVVVNVQHNWAPFLEAKQRTGKLTIVSSGRNDSLGCYLEGRSFDVQRVVYCAVLSEKRRSQQAMRKIIRVGNSDNGKRACTSYELTARKGWRVHVRLRSRILESLMMTPGKWNRGRQ